MRVFSRKKRIFLRMNQEEAETLSHWLNHVPLMIEAHANGEGYKLTAKEKASMERMRHLSEKLSGAVKRGK